MSVRDSLLSPLAAIASADLETPALTSVAAALRRLDSRFVARGAEPFDAMEAAMVGALAQTLCATDGDDLPPPGLYERILREVELPLIALTLSATRGNQLKAADLLGLNRNTLRKRIRDLDIAVTRGKKLM